MKSLKTHITGKVAAAALLLLSLLSPAEAGAQDSNNYIKKTTYTTSSGSSSDSYTDATYYDGLGYPSQEVSSKWSGTNSLVTPMTYDVHRRQDKEWLPFSSGAAGSGASYVSNARTLQNSALGDSCAFRETIFEGYPQGRPLSIRREGEDWGGNPGHRTCFTYRTNTSSGDKIHRFSYSRGASLTASSISTTGFYPDNSLRCTGTTDEHGDLTEVFTDGWGRTVCTRQHIGNSSADTYCVYDLRDSLVCVIQPKLADGKKSATSFSIGFNSDDAGRYCFLWQYDGRGNVIECQTPGGGVNSYIYDQRDRLVFDSSQEMRDNGVWRQTIYDGFNRAVGERYVCLDQSGIADMRSYLVSNLEPSGNLDVISGSVSRVYYPFSGEPAPTPTRWSFTSQIETLEWMTEAIAEELEEVDGLVGTYSSNTTAGRYYRRIKAALERERSALDSAMGMYSAHDGRLAVYDPDGSVRGELNHLLDGLDGGFSDILGFGYLSGTASSYMDGLESHMEELESMVSAAEQLPLLVSAFFASEVIVPVPDSDPFGVLQSFVADDVATTGDLNTEQLYGLLRQETFCSVPGMTAQSSSAAPAIITRRYYYDGRGRVIQIQETGPSTGDSSRISTKYDFCGNVMAVKETHTSPDTDGEPVTHTLKTTYTRDTRGRMTGCSRTFDGIGTGLGAVIYTYDDLGRLTGKSVNGKVSETYAYDLHGWQTGMEASYGGTTIFSESLRYQDATGKKATTQPRWDGRISEAVTLHAGQQASQAYSYFYDALGRLCDVSHYDGNTLKDNCATERDITYDLNGNILSLVRYETENAGGTIAMSHGNGNRLTTAGGSTYGYDNNGNLTSDSRKGLEFSYNVLNLPETVTKSDGGCSLTYTYLADGTKVSAVIDGGEGLRYSGSFVYAVSADGSETLESVGWDEGRICFCENEEADEPVYEPINGGRRLLMGAVQPDEPGDSTAVYTTMWMADQWFVRDHLGNVRSVVDLSAPEGSTAETALVEQSDYLPFGTRIAVTTGTDASDNRYRYAGKEEQRFGTGPSPMDLEHLDFGARFYDPFTARWTTTDPLASKYPSISPYAYCGNDPINRVDPDGKIFETAWDILNVVMDAKSLASNIKQGNVGASIVDGVSLTVDALAAVIPVVPAGAGIVVKAARGADKTIDAVKAVDKTNEVSNAVRANVQAVDNTSGLSRSGAFRQAKRDAGIPISQQPDAVNHVEMRGARNPDGAVIQSREYVFKTGPETIIIQDHSSGHQLYSGEAASPHFNVRKTTKYNIPIKHPEGAKDHYIFSK